MKELLPSDPRGWRPSGNWPLEFLKPRVPNRESWDPARCRVRTMIPCGSLVSRTAYDMTLFENSESWDFSSNRGILCNSTTFSSFFCLFKSAAMEKSSLIFNSTLLSLSASFLSSPIFVISFTPHSITRIGSSVVSCCNLFQEECNENVEGMSQELDSSWEI